LRTLDTLLAERGGEWWSEFFADRSRAIPFFASWPDENLAGWLDDGHLTPGRVLEIGCGNGRNAAYLAGRGCRVDAVDYSQEAIGWARERAEAAGVAVSFQCCSIFDAQIEAGAYDLVYDSGCFHHLAPHRRQDYLDLVGAALKPGGRFGLVCFRAAASALQLTSYGCCGTGRPSRCACSGRWSTRTGHASARTSCGRCSPSRTAVS